MNSILKTTLYSITFTCTFFNIESQTKIPNIGFNQFHTICNSENSYELPLGWKEHEKNDFWRLRDGHGIAYKYNLPDANENAVALHRGISKSHITETNAIFNSFLTPINHKSLKLVGRYKFSGSDIEETSDTLKILVFSTIKQIKSLINGIPKNATSLELIIPKAQFDWFHLDLSKIKKNNYLTIVIQLTSGSDDDFYYGYSNAVIDELKLVKKQDL